MANISLKAEIIELQRWLKLTDLALRERQSVLLVRQAEMTGDNYRISCWKLQRRRAWMPRLIQSSDLQHDYNESLFIQLTGGKVFSFPLWRSPLGKTNAEHGCTGNNADNGWNIHAWFKANHVNAKFYLHCSFRRTEFFISLSFVVSCCRLLIRYNHLSRIKLF